MGSTVTAQRDATVSMRVWGRAAEPTASVPSHFPCEPGAEPPAGGHCGGLEGLYGEEGGEATGGAAAWAAGCGQRTSLCGISSLGAGARAGRHNRCPSKAGGGAGRKDEGVAQRGSWSENGRGLAHVARRPEAGTGGAGRSGSQGPGEEDEVTGAGPDA